MNNIPFNKLVEMVVLLLADPESADLFTKESMIADSWNQEQHMIWSERTAMLLLEYHVGVFDLIENVKRAITLTQTNINLPENKRPYLDIFVLSLQRENIDWDDLSQTKLSREQPLLSVLPVLPENEDDL